MTTRIAKGEAAIAAGVLALAAFVAFGTSQIGTGGMVSQVGPRLVPYLVGGGLAALGLALGWAALHGGWPSEDDEETGPADWRALAWLGAGLLLNLLLIGPLGFSVAVTVMFVLVARAFASPRPLHDAAIGLAIALAAWICFEKVLGIQVGGGVLEAAIDRFLLAPLGLA